MIVSLMRTTICYTRFSFCSRTKLNKSIRKKNYRPTIYKYFCPSWSQKTRDWFILSLLLPLAMECYVNTARSCEVNHPHWTVLLPHHYDAVCPTLQVLLRHKEAHCSKKPDVSAVMETDGMETIANAEPTTNIELTGTTPCLDCKAYNNKVIDAKPLNIKYMESAFLLFQLFISKCNI